MVHDHEEYVSLRRQLEQRAAQKRSCIQTERQLSLLKGAPAALAFALHLRDARQVHHRQPNGPEWSDYLNWPSHRRSERGPQYFMAAHNLAERLLQRRIIEA